MHAQRAGPPLEPSLRSNVQVITPFNLPAN